MPAVLLLTLTVHAVLALAYVPVNSDLTVYQRYAAAVAKSDETGGSFSLARDEALQRDAQANGRPEPSANDLLVEYPPLAVTWMAAVGYGLDPDSLPGSMSEAYTVRYRLAMFGFDLALIVSLVMLTRHLADSDRGDRERARRLAVYGIGAAILGNLLFDRLDLIVGTLLLFSLVLLTRGSWRFSFLLLAVAINFKASPIALAPLWVVASMPSHLLAANLNQWRSLVATIVARTASLVLMSAVLFLPFVATEGTRAFDFLRFRAIQGVQVESVPASALLLLQSVGMPLEVRAALGAYELDTPVSATLAAVSPVLIVVTALLVVAVYVRSARWDTTSDGILAARQPRVLVIATASTLFLTVLTSKVLSPQYVLWLLPVIPLMVLGAGRTHRFQVGFLAACTVTTAIFPYLYGRTIVRQDPAGDGFLDPTLLGVGLLVLRNGMLIWLAWLAVRPLLEPPIRGPSVALSSGTTSGA